MAEIQMQFPLPFVPTSGYRGGLGFGADRSRVAQLLNIPGGRLRHGACDLLAKAGTPVVAMDDGVVVRSASLFFLNVYALEIRHPLWIARYCEIGSNVEVSAGSTVRAGQVIAYVGDQPGDDMLHLEMFSGAAAGDLSLDRNNPANAPYYRRSDLMDPTPILDSLLDTVAPWTGKFITDDEGAKFLDV